LIVFYLHAKVCFSPKQVQQRQGMEQKMGGKG
jgi:hypothetical protein